MNEDHSRSDGRGTPGVNAGVYTGKQNMSAQGKAPGSTRESVSADAGSAYARRQGPLSGYDAGYPRRQADPAESGSVSFRNPGAARTPSANPRGYSTPDPYRHPAPPVRPDPRQAGPDAQQNPAIPRPAGPQGSRDDGAARQGKPAQEQKRADGYLDRLSDGAENPVFEENPARRQREPLSPKDKKQIAILAVADAVVFLFIVGMLIFKGDVAVNRIKKIVTQNEGAVFYEPATYLDGLAPHLKSAAYPDGIDPAMMPLYSENNDYVGWLRVPGTGIDNAVVQGRDNNTYLRADFYRRPNKRTRLFFGDFRNHFTRFTQDYSKVTIIYGHHLSSDTRIFAEIENYADLDYYKTHPTVEFYTLYGKTTWKIFGVFYTAVNVQNDPGSMFYYWNPSVTDAETPAFCNEILSRSHFVNPAVDIQPTDKILCLSTCTYIIKNDYDNRCVLMARLVRDGENPEVDVSAAYANTNRRMPHGWYVQQGMSDPFENTPVFTAGQIG